MNTATVFAATFATLFAAHQLADHLAGQTDHQATHKDLPGWKGWKANLAHVGLYHAVMAVMLGVAVLVLDLPVSWGGVLVGLGFSAVTHAVLDRRWPVRWLLRKTGSAPFAETAQGMYVGDQACHYACLWVAALMVAVI